MTREEQLEAANVPLYELHADAAYLAHRVAQGTMKPDALAQHIRAKIDAALAAPPTPDMAMHIALNDVIAALGEAKTSAQENPGQPAWEALDEGIRLVVSIQRKYAAAPPTPSVAGWEAGRDPAAGLFHAEQVRVWADEILSDLALNDLMTVETYDDKVSAFLAIQGTLNEISNMIRSLTPPAPAPWVQPPEAERPAMDALSAISSYLGAGMGDAQTTAEQFYDRIMWGITDQLRGMANLAAQKVEGLSRDGATWGQVKRAILDLAPPPPGGQP